MTSLQDKGVAQLDDISPLDVEDVRWFSELVNQNQAIRIMIWLML